MIMKRNGCLLLLLLFCLTLTGCRTRITANTQAERSKENGEAYQTLFSGPLTDDSANEQEKNEDSEGQTKENPEASRKEYDENASAEIVPGAERTVHGQGEGGGAFAAGEDTQESADKLNSMAKETTLQTVSAEQSEQMGVSEDAKEADSAMTYYTTLLQDRTGSLFECQRLSVYWETKEDHVTVFKTSLEHSLILNAGAYDVSARLLEENLRVDDGWIGRKNPGVIVKAVDSSVLGAGVSSTANAQKVYVSLLARGGWQSMDAVRNGRVILLSEELLKAPYLRLAAMLMIAKTANAGLYSDVDIGKALEMLAQEAVGAIPSGIYCYNGLGGF